MSNSQQADYQTTQQIEKEYINNMLDINCQDVASVEVIHEIKDFDSEVNHNEAYENSHIECTVLNIVGLNIAIPLSNIREVLLQQPLLKNDEKNSAATMCAGSINHNNETIDVIDIEHLIMNGAGSFSSQDENQLVDIVLLKNTSTAFVANKLLDKQTVSKEDVHWRDANSERIWLAGTVAQLGLSLLDIEGVLKLLHSQR